MIQCKTATSGARIFRYARVSAEDQDLAIQHAALEAAGCMTIFAEKKSETRRDGRTVLQVLLECVREGDTVVITGINRLARSMRGLRNSARAEREGRRAQNHRAANRYWLSRRQGFPRYAWQRVYKGGKPSIDVAKAKAMRTSGMGPAAIAKQLKMVRSPVYWILAA